MSRYKKPETKMSLEKKKKKSTMREIIETILLAALLYFAIDFCVARVRVENISMETTFHEGQLLMVNKLNYKFGEPERGQVIVFKAPTEPGKAYIKRLIGLPGDTIEVKTGELFVNGAKIQEPWRHEPMAYSGAWTMGTNEYFALGDNRNHSSDSHVWGGIPRENLIGDAFFRYWPLNRLSLINDTWQTE